MTKYNFPMTLDRQFKNQLEYLHDKYGDEMMRIEGMSPNQLDTCKFFKNFMKTNTVADATIDDNANVTNKNITTMLNEANKPFLKLLSRNKLYIEMKEEFGIDVANEFLESVINGELYEHDSFLSSYQPYCFAFSLKPIVEKGLYFIEEMRANPPQHWDTFNHHVLEFVSYATNQTAGATGLPDYLIYAYYFYQKDTQNMTDEQTTKYRNQKFQEVIFNLNQPYLKSGIQSAYTNFSILDVDHIAKFFSEEKYPDGSDIIAHLDGIMQFQQDFLDYVGELRKEKWYTFPVISASLIFRDGKYLDEETAKMVVEHNWKYGFNDVNIMNVEEATSLASCCRLVSNKDELNKNKIFNSIGGSDVNVGSTKVVTLNLVRLALLSKNEDDFIKLVEEKTKLIHKYHFAHRNTLKKLIKKGLLPLYTYKMMSLDDQFATVGINGVYEAMKILGGISRDEQGYYYNEKGFEIAQRMFNTILKLNETTIDKYEYMSNIEQIPAESAAIKLNKKDRIYFGNRYINDRLGENCYIYGNQWIPLKEETSIWHRIDAAKLDNYCGGGAILHINLGENFNTFEDAWEFTNGLAKKGVKYFSYISLIDICENDHSFFGDVCPICSEKSVTKGIKIVGYLVKMNSFKKERKQELGERKFYNLN